MVQEVSRSYFGLYTCACFSCFWKSFISSQCSSQYFVLASIVSFSIHYSTSDIPILNVQHIDDELPSSSHFLYHSRGNSWPPSWYTFLVPNNLFSLSCHCTIFSTICGVIHGLLAGTPFLYLIICLARVVVIASSRFFRLLSVVILLHPFIISLLTAAANSVPLVLMFSLSHLLIFFFLH